MCYSLICILFLKSELTPENEHRYCNQYNFKAFWDRAFIFAVWGTEHLQEVPTKFYHETPIGSGEIDVSYVATGIATYNVADQKYFFFNRVPYVRCSSNFLCWISLAHRWIVSSLGDIYKIFLILISQHIFKCSGSHLLGPFFTHATPTKSSYLMIFFSICNQMLVALVTQNHVGRATYYI